MVFYRLSRKSDASPTESAPGWKLFGKIPPKEAPEKSPDDVSLKFKTKGFQNSNSSPVHQNLASQTLENISPPRKSLGHSENSDLPKDAEEPAVKHPEKETSKSTFREMIRRSDREVPSTTALILEQRPGYVLEL
jgi:hypothetical protein